MGVGVGGGGGGGGVVGDAIDRCIRKMHTDRFWPSVMDIVHERVGVWGGGGGGGGDVFLVDIQGV